jgi:L-arabinokinase
MDKTEPVATLLRRVRQELGQSFDFSRRMIVSRSPGRLDVMGGIADYTGSLVCEATLDRAAAVLLQERADRQIHVWSLNLADEGKPSSFSISLDELASAGVQGMRQRFAEESRRWAGYLVGCFSLLQEQKLLDPGRADLRGVNLALYSTVPLGAGVSSSAAVEVAAMMGVLRQYRAALGGGEPVDPMRIATMCQAVENRVVGAPCGIMDQVTSLCGRAGQLLRMVCQPHELKEPLKLPAGVRVVGINSRVKHSVGGGQYGLTRCAAFMGHTIILDLMRALGVRARRPLVGDPMKGYLANLDPEDYKRLFRRGVPERISGEDFLSRYGPTIDTATAPQARQDYFVRQATDHHVLENRRVHRFAALLEQAGGKPHGTREQGLLLDQAGHLMYASHRSYGRNALLGAPECDLLVELVKKREPRGGLYGAKITGGGSGGTVAVLCDVGDRVDELLGEILEEYERETGNKPEAFTGTSEGALYGGAEEIVPENKG